MSNNSLIFEGKTTNEAIEKGLKELKVSKDKVEIKVLKDEDKRSFFSILAPRVVKVEMKLKENQPEKVEEIKPKEIIKKEYNSNMEEIENAKKDIDVFLKEFVDSLKLDLEYSIKIENFFIYIDIKGEKAGSLIGYRGDTLNSLQNIISSIANKKCKERIKVILDIENYRAKREKALEDLADKVARTVLKTGKSVTLEPMSPYERKVIHNKLQGNDKVETHSIGENENRRVVIAKITRK